MSIKVIGAGLGRTGTYSLKLALERLLGGPCYHMKEVFDRLEHVPHWHAAAEGRSVDWNSLFEGYVATVDWPSASFYRELADHYPDATVILSTRSPETWWNSANETIFGSIGDFDPEFADWHAMIGAILENRFTKQISDRDACIEAFERHNAEVRATIPPHRLLEWSARDGWEPLCQFLGVPLPEEPFPHANSKEEFLARRQKSQEERQVAR